LNNFFIPSRTISLLLAIIIVSTTAGYVWPLFGVLLVRETKRCYFRNCLNFRSKWALIGRCKSGRYRLWTWFYLRWWLAQQICRTVCGGAGHYPHALYLRMLGARVGSNVHIHKNADLGICADLLTIGNNVNLSIICLCVLFILLFRFILTMGQGKGHGFVNIVICCLVFAQCHLRASHFSSSPLF
jgi:hypothetical protein